MANRRCTCPSRRGGPGGAAVSPTTCGRSTRSSSSGTATKLTIDDADSRTLLTLLTLREMWPVDATPRVRIIAQLLDQANAALADTTGVDDFIVSDALASLMLAQLSERAELQAVFDDLFDPNGAVVELRPAHRFVPDAPVRYEQIVAAGAAPTCRCSAGASTPPARSW